MVVMVVVVVEVEVEVVEPCLGGHPLLGPDEQVDPGHLGAPQQLLQQHLGGAAKGELSRVLNYLKWKNGTDISVWCRLQ